MLRHKLLVGPVVGRESSCCKNGSLVSDLDSDLVGLRLRHSEAPAHFRESMRTWRGGEARFQVALGWNVRCALPCSRRSKRNPACRDQRRDGVLTDEPLVERLAFLKRQVGKRSVNSRPRLLVEAPRAPRGKNPAPRSFRAEIPERDGVAQAVHGRNAVLPFAPRRPPQQVGGPRLGGERGALPARSRPLPQAKEARRQQGNAYHLAENRFVFVPADRGAGRIFGEKNVLQFGCVEAGESGGASRRASRSKS